MTGVVDFGRCGCQFPLWPDGERYLPGVSLFCGEPRGAGPYCPRHLALAASTGTSGERTAPTVLRHLTAQGL